MNHCTCLVVGVLCKFKWLPCFALLRRKSGNACFNHFVLQKQWTRSTVRILLDSSREPCDSLSPMCGTASIGVHLPCTKLLHTRVHNCTVDYPDRSAAVMPNELSNHKTPTFPAVSLMDEATIISLFSLSFLSWRKPQLASPSSCSSFLQENPDLLLPLFFSPKEGKVSASMVLILAKARSRNPETYPITPSLFFY